jgi:DNA-directed RNA polymerase subunit RPC12/RpoP
MKPRTQFQFEVMEQHQRLYKREAELLPWAKRECLDHIGYATKNRVVCMDCGETFSPDLIKRKRATCPHCGTKLTIEQSRKQTHKQREYFAIGEIFRGYQVMRYFELFSYHKIGKDAQYSCHEIIQLWIREDGKYQIVAKNHTTSFNCDSWNGDMEIRKNYRSRYSYYYNPNRYDCYPQKYHPDSEFRPEYRKYGINSKLRGLTFLEAISYIPTHPQAETLLKAKQYALLGATQGGYESKVRNYWPSIRICMRNKYTVKDAQIYFDYLDLVDYFNKDLRNAHYVCPKDLKKEHDRLVVKKRKIREAEELQRKRLRVKKNEAAYKEFISRFTDLQFGDKEIKIRPLQSVEEFMKEGDAMHHCLFTNDYFKKTDSLILSARKGNQRLETIEVNLENLKVVQSRGKFNSATEFHDRILQLVERNKNQIKKRMLNPEPAMQDSTI